MTSMTRLLDILILHIHALVNFGSSFLILNRERVYNTKRLSSSAHNFFYDYPLTTSFHTMMHYVFTALSYTFLIRLCRNILFINNLYNIYTDSFHIGIIPFMNMLFSARLHDVRMKLIRLQPLVVSLFW